MGEAAHRVTAVGEQILAGSPGRPHAAGGVEPIESRARAGLVLGAAAGGPVLGAVPCNSPNPNPKPDLATRRSILGGRRQGAAGL